jgi:hypothetical protein
VVTFIAVLCAELPAALEAETLKVYVVCGDNPVMDAFGVVEVANATPFRKIV